jgi:hypothetical protein
MTSPTSHFKVGARWGTWGQTPTPTPPPIGVWGGVGVAVPSHFKVGVWCGVGVSR